MFLKTIKNSHDSRSKEISKKTEPLGKKRGGMGSKG